jgi:uncharacterized protein (DUF1800 family)
MSANRADMADGHDVLDLVAAHPGTARFITRKLCRYLIGDNPPQAVLDAAAAEFAANISAPNQIALVLQVIITSDAFKTTWGDKFKRPFEAALSQLRALNTDFTPSDEFNWNYESMNMPLFEHRTPDGYPDIKERWTNTTSLLKRWQLAVSLTENYLTGSTVNAVNQMPGSVNTATAIVDFWINRLLNRPLSKDAARTRLIDFVRGPHAANFVLESTYVADILPRFVALLMMSPDFQVY